MIKHLVPVLTTTALCFLPSIAQSQTYTPSGRTPQADNSIGTIVTPTGNNFNITGGLQRGQNLFHSFTEFSIPTGGAANFINPQQTPSIITRVTGNNFSDLNGTLNTNGANFLLINPNGVVFGTNAILNVGKAFVTSTASGVDFVDAQGRNYNFGVNRAGDALLSIAPDVAFTPARLIMGGGTGAISNFGQLETTNPNQYIGLIGGNVSMNGGQINAPGGRVEIGGLSTFGTVALTDINNIRAQFPANVGRGDVSLTNGARVNVAGAGSGDIAISARNLEILSGSLVRGGIETGLGTPEAVAGDININATGDIAVVGSTTAPVTGIANNVRLNSKGNGGNVTIAAGSLSLRDGAQLQASTVGTGNAGNVTVTAKDAVSLAGSYIFSTVEAGGVGKGGMIDINAGSLSMTNGAQLSTVTRTASATQPAGQGDAGNITVNVSGAVDITGSKDRFPSGILTQVGTGTKGNGGNITIAAGSFSLRDGAQLIASTLGTGNAGNVTVTAKDAVSLAGQPTAILSAVEAGGVGKGGTIDINAGSLSINGAQLLTITRSRASATQPAGQGDAGNITVNVSGAVDIAGINNRFYTGMFSQVVTGSKGNGGNITISAGSLSLRDGGLLEASTFGEGNAGTIKVNTTDFLTIANKNSNFNTGLFVDSSSLNGTTGDIIVTSANITLENGGISARSLSGKGGNIIIGGKLKGGSAFSPDSNIDLSNLTPTELLLLRNGSGISTDAGGTAQQGGGGGNININSKLIVAIPKENSDITANAVKGRGGNVNINTQGLFGIQFRPQQTDNNDITASSDFGQNGIVNISTPGTDPGRDSTELPNTTTDASNQISQVCSANNRQNKLTVTGRGGLPPNANELLESESVWQDPRGAKPNPATTASQTPKFAPPAVGWVLEQNGRVRLIAAQTVEGATGTKAACPTLNN